MAHSRGQLPLVMGLIGSIVLHVGVILPVLLLVLTTRGESERLHTELQPERDKNELPEPPEESDKPTLGIDAPNPSSLTWVGYEEYEEHLARLSEVEQAAFRLTETGLPDPEMAMPDEVSPEDVPTEPSETPQPDEIEAEVDAQEQPLDLAEVNETELNDIEAADDTAESVDAQLSAPSLLPFDRIAVVEGFTPAESTEEAGPDSGDAFDEESASPPEFDGPVEDEPAPAEGASADTDDADTSGMDATDPSSDEASRDEREPREPAEPSSQDAASPQQGEPDEGEVSDKEADATSSIEVPPENWRLGRPLAAQGVELKPQRPHFTMLQRLSTSPGNPLVEIRFGQDGVPVQASIIKSSGSQSIDGFLESSLYRWRATGEEIEALADSETFDVRIQIIFNPRASRRSSERSE